MGIKIGGKEVSNKKFFSVGNILNTAVKAVEIGSMFTPIAPEVKIALGVLNVMTSKKDTASIVKEVMSIVGFKNGEALSIIADVYQNGVNIRNVSSMLATQINDPDILRILQHLQNISPDQEKALRCFLESAKIGDVNDKMRALNYLDHECQNCLDAGDIPRAMELLTQSIFTDNTSERRSALIKLYVSQCDKNVIKTAEQAVEWAHLQVIELGIPGAASDFAEFLTVKNRIDEAIHWYVVDKNFEKAYQCVDIHNKQSIRIAIDEFSGKNAAYEKSLNLMLRKHTTLEEMFHITAPPRHMTPKYLFLGFFYAIKRTWSMFGVFGIIGYIAIIFLSIYADFKDLIIMALPTAILFIDTYRYDKWVDCYGLYNELTQPILHNQLSGLKAEAFSNGF